MSQIICDTHGRKLTYAEISRAMLTLNLASGFATICVMLMYPGYTTLTVFLNEWLLTPASTIGFILMIAAILPVIQPLMAQVVQRVQHRKRFILWGNSILYAGVFVLALVPLLGRSSSALYIGLIITCIVVFAALLIMGGLQLVLWTWIGDLVPEHRRNMFFGQGSSIAIFMGTLGFLASSYAIDHFGGTQNPYVMSGTFVFAGMMGFVAVYLLSRVPDVPVAKVENSTFRQFILMIVEPIRDKKFLRLLMFISIVAFFWTLTNSFTILYARAASVGGHNPGFGMSLQYWAVISTVVGIVGIVAGPFWGWIGDRLGTKFIMAAGCIGLLWYWVFFISTPSSYHIQMFLGMAFFGWFFPAYNIGWNTSAFNLSSNSNRAAYMATIPFAMMLSGVGAMVGGYLSDKFSVMEFNLPSGIPFAYIHLLTIITTVGAFLAICAVPLIPLHDQRTIRELLPIVFDWRFLLNIIRAQFLAYTSSPLVMIWALKGLRGRSAEIAFKEMADKITDADSGVRYAAIDAVEKLGSQQSRELMDRIHTDSDDSVGQGALLAVSKGPKYFPQVLDAFGRISSEAIRREIAVYLANTITAKSDFYGILTREIVAPGSRFPKLTKRVEISVRHLPQFKERIFEAVLLMDENYHLGMYDKVLAICNSLLKEIDCFGSESLSTTPQIVDELLAITCNRPEKSQAVLELLLGVYLTSNYIEAIACSSPKLAVLPKSGVELKCD